MELSYTPPDMPTGNADLAARRVKLAAVLGSLDENYDGDARQLRAAVCEYTDCLRDSGAPPERVVIAVKTAAAPALTHLPVHAHQATVERLVQWCIAEYYRPV